MADRVDGLLLDRREAELAAILIRLGARQLEQRNGARSAAADRLISQLERFARTGITQVSAPREPANLPGAPEGACSAAEAAQQLGVTPKSARQLCRRGVLLAIRDGGVWRIDPGSVAAEAARREEMTGT